MLTDNRFTVRDGTELYVHSQLPDTPDGIVLFVHGLGEHIGRYDKLFQYFFDRGLGCVGFDQRGHGKSDGKRGHAPSYEHLLDDIQEILDKVIQSYSEIPILLFGHSMGGNLSLNFLIRRQPENIRTAIIASPWLELSVKPSSFKILLAAIMHRLVPAFSNSNGLDPEGLSSDPEVARRYKDDPLVHDKISAGLFTEMYRAGRYALEHAGELTTRILLLHGGDDPITSPEASEKLAKKNPEMIRFKLFPGMRHETHNEKDKELVMEEEWQWLKSNL